VFTDTEQKLIKLALNEGTQVGEIQNSAVMLIQSLRRRGMRPEALIVDSQLPAQEPLTTALDRARRRVMPFGRYAGRKLDAIEPGYLRWALRECSCLSLGLREAMRLVLSQGGSA
jgi:uncharacterized protein (DUF3820 family)